MLETNGQELVSKVEDSAIERIRPKPTLVKLDNGRLVSSDGLYHPDLAGKYIMENGRVRWISTGELSRIFTGANTLRGKDRVRKRASSTFRWILENLNEFLLYETGKHGRIEHVKILDVESFTEIEQAQVQLKRMLNSKELSAQKYSDALAVIGLKEALASE